MRIQRLKNEMLPTFELKIISKIVPAELLDLVPKTEPSVIAVMERIANKHIGIMNLFLRYQ
jgi:hypothetical protein